MFTGIVEELGSFEARDDIFYRASRWCDLIASSLKIGPELGAPPATSP